MLLDCLEGTLNAKAVKLSVSLEKAFAVLVLLLSTGALVQLLLNPGLGSTFPPTSQFLAEGDPINQAIWVGIYCIVLLLVIARWKQFIQVTTRDKLLLLLVGIALLSVLWSDAPEVTLRRTVGLIGTTMIGAYLATRFSPSMLLRLLAWAMGIAALLSFVFAVALPSYGIEHTGTGAWQGIYVGGKNALGRAMALSALVFCLLAFSGGRYRWVAWGGFGLSVGLILLSDSQTSLVSLLIVLLLLPAYAALRLRYTLAIPCVIVVALVGGIAALWIGNNLSIVLEVLDRDVTLTTRTDLWPAVLDVIWHRPLLGYGYGAFWLGWQGESAHVWLWNRSVHLESLHAHNGILDLWLNLGLLGVLTFTGGFLLAFLRAIDWARLRKTAVELLPITFLTLMLLYNILESAILIHNNIMWILYVTVVLWLGVRPPKAHMTDSIDANFKQRNWDEKG